MLYEVEITAPPTERTEGFVHTRIIDGDEPARENGLPPRPVIDQARKLAHYTAADASWVLSWFRPMVVKAGAPLTTTHITPVCEASTPNGPMRHGFDMDRRL